MDGLESELLMSRFWNPSCLSIQGMWESFALQLCNRNVVDVTKLIFVKKCLLCSIMSQLFSHVSTRLLSCGQPDQTINFQSLKFISLFWNFSKPSKNYCGFFYIVIHSIILLQQRLSLVGKVTIFINRGSANQRQDFCYICSGLGITIM